MNSILSIHFESPAEGADVVMLALRRLGLYLDTEADLLAEVLQVAKRQRAAYALEALSALHLEPENSDQDIRGLLERARDMLAEVLDEVRTIPTDWTSSGIEDFDARVNWAGARVQDILATLDWSLD
jgi:hypothetical protein